MHWIVCVFFKNKSTIVTNCVNVYIPMSTHAHTHPYKIKVSNILDVVNSCASLLTAFATFKKGHYFYLTNILNH